MKRGTLMLAWLLLAFVASSEAMAACPTGKKPGDVYCRDGYWWKCDRCAGVDCEILQADRGRCLKDDAPFEVTGLWQFMQPRARAPLNMSPRSPHGN